MSLETILSFFVLMLISIGTYFVSRRIRVPYTVLLVLVGSLLVPLTHVEFFAFLKAFRLTPELLFYLFLPILIFESAYNMRVRQKQNIEDPLPVAGDKLVCLRNNRKKVLFNGGLWRVKSRAASKS